MFNTYVILETWSGLINLCTVRTSVTEVEMRLNMSSHIVLVPVLLATVVTLPGGPLAITGHYLDHGLQHQVIQICRKYIFTEL